MDDPYALAGDAADALRGRFGIDRIDLALVLGSGWAQASQGLGEPIGECPLADLPGFSAPVVAGHGGALRLVLTASGSVAAILTGRTHLYEGRGVAPVVHGVRTAAAAGASTLVLTNGCGGIAHAPGAPVLIADQINLTGATPLVGPRFIDLTEVYSSRLRALAKDVDPSLEEGIYCQFHGPAYETPAEVQMAKVIGGTLVGMSTALEAIAAREAGLEVLGISLVTNAAAGIASEPLSHAEVVEAGLVAQPRLRGLLAGLWERL
ncbi:purine-nucleoside phosphorylase [Micropruina sp.]|uniref:purine-nucleoside phosphorylase n=1 Tax=Micropruina sp. TaxID=2737536 RepID=UPI002627B5D7|nr:purine-nucleoside phosphorylase [Micropruina sp.]